MEINRLLHEKHGGVMTPAARRDIARLKRGEPLDYVIGWIPFLGCHVDLSARPLIPRPETEYWVNEAIALIHKNSGQPAPRILDLFCGSGCIGIAALKHLAAAQIDFADIVSKYFPGIRRSLKLNKINAKRARFLRANVFSGVRGSYDYIFANPPYIPRGASHRHLIPQEPKRALFGGADGLKFIRVLLRDGHTHLAPGGVMFLEFGTGQKTAIAKLAQQYGWCVDFKKDQYGKWRWGRLTRQLGHTP